MLRRTNGRRAYMPVPGSPFPDGKRSDYIPCMPGCRRKRAEILPMQAPGGRRQSGGGYGNKVKSGKRFPGTGKHGPREEKPAVFGRNGLIQPGRAVKTVRRHSLSMQGNVVGRCGRCVPESAPGVAERPCGLRDSCGPGAFFLRGPSFHGNFCSRLSAFIHCPERPGNAISLAGTAIRLCRGVNLPRRPRG